MKNAIFALFLLCIVKSSYGVVGNLGTATQVQANTATTITYGLVGPSLVITTDQTAQVTLSNFVSVTASLPSGISSLSFGAQVGYQLAITPSNAKIISATLTTPSLSASAIAILTGNVDAGVLQFDGSSYNEIDAQYQGTTNTFSVPLPTVGTYVFVGIAAEVPIQSYFGYVRQLAAGVATTVNYTGTFLLNVTANSNTNVQVNFSSTTDIQADYPSNFTSLGAYFDIETSSSTSLNANLAYNLSTTAADNAYDTLSWFFYNGSSWVQVDSSVNANTNLLVANTNHFSQWTVAGRNAGGDGSSSSSSAAILIPTLFSALLALAL